MTTSLLNRKILVTREASQAKKFSKMIAQFGGVPIEVPLLDIHCLKNIAYEPLWNRLDSYNWLFFTSANGVACFFQELDERKQTIHLQETFKIAAVGHKTEEALKVRNISADFIPSVYDADTMSAEFLARYPEEQGPILLIRGTRSRDVLPKVFAENGIIFDALEIYETVTNMKLDSTLQETMYKESFDFITFTSPSCIQAFIEMGGTKYLHSSTVISCIGTTTEKKARQVGFTNIIVPRIFTIEGMIESMATYLTKEVDD